MSPPRINNAECELWRVVLGGLVTAETKVARG